MHKFANKFNYTIPKSLKLSDKSVVDKLLYEPLPMVIARMAQSGFVASEYKRKMAQAVYDSKIIGSNEDTVLAEVTPLPRYSLDLVDNANLNASANAYFKDKQAKQEQEKVSAAETSASSPAPTPSEV